MQLFMAYVGGQIDGANTELHDVRFAVGETIQDCYPSLQAQWWGDKKSLHIDSWGAVRSADGYAVSVSEAPATHPEKLYFLNLGGYDPEQFTELHKNILLVAPSEAEAKKKAKAMIKDWTQPHRDNWFEIEHMLELSSIDGVHIHLEKTSAPAPFQFECGYHAIRDKA